MEAHDKTISKRDKVTLVLSPLAPGDVVANGALRLTIVPDGRSSISRYNSGKWSVIESTVAVKIALGGAIDDNSDEDEGYILELSIPKDELKLSDGVAAFNASVYDAAANMTGELEKVVYLNNL